MYRYETALASPRRLKYMEWNIWSSRATILIKFQYNFIEFVKVSDFIFEENAKYVHLLGLRNIFGVKKYGTHFATKYFNIPR